MRPKKPYGDRPPRVVRKRSPLGSPSTPIAGTRAIDVKCPTCDALPDELCTEQTAGGRFGTQLQQVAPHPARIKFAAKFTRDANRSAREP